jgi:alpha-galactosidase/6-phospho-beta-glucosidase family protein
VGPQAGLLDDATTVTTDEIDIVAAGINHQTWYVRRSGATST